MEHSEDRKQGWDMTKNHQKSRNHQDMEKMTHIHYHPELQDNQST
jgi:hypothetical protein